MQVYIVYLYGSGLIGFVALDVEHDGFVWMIRVVVVNTTETRHMTSL